eukprot:TRINITY_DN4561_c3_g1_i1.p1 TRINITY_DN4561_c3_g1~~TRINITY_DN4561_c3_g1_i1.p1  ORF type:complete len:784 (+),score=105.17 TRINITY_DN4561_c3_g1_i1:122-2473(+)
MMFIVLVTTLSVAAAMNVFEEMTSTQNDQWMAIPHKNISADFGIHPQAGICTFRDTIYMHGGLDAEDNLLNDFIQLDLTTMTYSTVALAPGSPNPGGRRKHFLLADEDNGKLYNVGGKDNDDISLWEFDVAAATWTRLNSDPPNFIDQIIEDTDYGIASVPGYLVVAGSKDGLSGEYLIYSKVDDVWFRLPTSDVTKVEDPVLIPHGYKVYLMGGSTKSQYLPNRTGVIDFSNGRENAVWEEIPGFPGEELQAFVSGGFLGIVGEPGGKGPLGSHNGIAMINITEGGNWTTIPRGSSWPPLSTDIRITQYKNKAILLGALIGEGFPSENIWVFDPSICSADCSGNGVCHIGVCQCRSSFSGDACETENTTTDLTPMITGTVVGGSVFMIIAIAVVWKQTSKMREYRKLYSTSRIAEDMAAQIASMELEQLDYLMEITSPTAIQHSFQTIVQSLKLYRSYLPESLLQKDSDDASSTEGESVKISKSHRSLGRLSSSGGTGTSDTNSRSPGGGVGVVLMKDLNRQSVREVAILRTVIHNKKESRSRYTSNLKITRHTEEPYRVLIDTIQQSVQTTRGLILSLDGDAVTCAWNFNLHTSMPSAHAAATAFKIGSTDDEFSVRHVITNKTGHCGVLGGSKIRQPVFVSSHMAVVDTLHKISAHRNLPVLTDLREVGSNYSLRPVDVIKQNGYLSCAGAVTPTEDMLEVYSLLEQATQGNEWMYELDAITARNEKIFDVVDVYKSAGSSAALSIISELPDAQQPQFRFLRETIELANAKSAGQVVLNV